MNKKNAFKIAILTLLLNGATSCTHKQNTDSGNTEPELASEIATLDSLGNEQNAYELSYIPYIRDEETARAYCTSATVRDSVDRITRQKAEQAIKLRDANQR